MKYWNNYLVVLLVLSVSWLKAQQPANGYQQPSKAITDLVDAPLTPGVSIGPDQETMLLISQPG
ncbi:MAG TPA: hypothetical protein PKD70_15240, partial [Saprospiraceae bacterium]|nr:hypothetical protein [Saprospiraceae bacterium]HMP15232.1 hypothetical protein [Saprospiraceae bacterium]